ncbi:MAG: iron ABC transporter permease [Sphaerobacter sp.]|nr:iron ABC transporter permease [Sphaerobacter sp.]
MPQPTTSTGARPRRAAREHLPPLLVLPALIVALLMVAPLGYLVLRAAAAGPELLPLLWRDRTLLLIRNSLLLAATVTAACVAIALPLAWLTARTDLPGRRLWTVATSLPLVIPSYVGGFAVIATLGPRGALQSLLEATLGIQRLPEIYGFFGAWLTLTLLSYPYLLLALRSALLGLDPALEEAARSLGLGPWGTFFRVTVPLLRPALLAGSLLVALYVLSDFGAVSLLRYDVFTRAIYNQYRGAFDRSLAAGLALVLVAITAVLLALDARARGRARYYRSTAGVTRPPARVRLGRWTPLALAYCAAIVTVTLVLPIGVIASWLVRGLRAGEPLRLVWSAALNSVGLSLLAGLVAILAALPIAILTVRHPSRLSHAIERLTYLGYGLPGIVVALALVFFGARHVPWLYQTLGMLVVAYLIRFLPQAVGTLRASLLQVSPRVEEAARSLGHSPPRVWLRVTMPLTYPGLFSAGALTFLTVMKELPATLLLRPTGFDTLATQVWSATAEAFWARGAAPALLLILLSALPMAVTAWRDSRFEP